MSGAPGDGLDDDDGDDGGAALAAVVGAERAAAADAVAAARFEPPSPGAPGLGDSLYPTLGNGGYQVEHYDLRLRYDTGGALPSLDGTVHVVARATQSLSRFDLDFAGDSVGAVRVDGFPAAFTRDGEELVITPPFPLLRGLPFLVTVEHFTATSAVAAPGVFPPPAFLATPDGTAWVMQPNAAHQVFPSNDHTTDKASFSFRIDVPEGTTAFANGEQTAVHTHNGRSVYRFEQREPMATELAQVAVGAFTVISRGEHAGVALRDVVPTALAADLEPKLASVANHLDFMEQLVGDYPFGSYGSLVARAAGGVGLETQTLSIYDAFFFTLPAATYEPIMVHEIAHQWFGDSVAPSQWADVWQNEGHATWYEFSFRFGVDSPSFTGFMQQVYLFGDVFRQVFGPVASPPSGDVAVLFNQNVYFGGALVLYALRQQIGDAAFQQLERTWVQTYRGKSASTADFIALASQVSGQDLTAFLTEWLYGTTTPRPMPGHPDWTVMPASAAAAASL
ncbi:MAG TPA: M1 family metallopeptidase, partial [Kofleriaceae bacterium]|nr:M1 family metallopeptidase [Kofleriaceae bacterium]